MLEQASIKNHHCNFFFKHLSMNFIFLKGKTMFDIFKFGITTVFSFVSVSGIARYIFPGYFVHFCKYHGSKFGFSRLQRNRNYLRGMATLVIRRCVSVLARSVPIIGCRSKASSVFASLYLVQVSVVLTQRLWVPLHSPKLSADENCCT